MEACRMRKSGEFRSRLNPRRRTADHRDTKATIRCIPFDRKKEAGKCMVTGKPSEGRAVFAKAY
jgi:hypothetical protein